MKPNKRLWYARAKLKPGSRIEILTDDGRVRCLATVIGFDKGGRPMIKIDPKDSGGWQTLMYAPIRVLS
jgi:hypothetical protein